MRKSKHTKEIDLDLTIPVNKKEIKLSEDNCLGNLFDMRTKECSVCAMNDICCILFQDKVEEKRKAIEAKNNKFLDLVDWNNLNEGDLVALCVEKSGVMMVEDLFNHIKEKVSIEDDTAVLEYIKKFKEDHGFKFRGGIVWKD